MIIGGYVMGATEGIIYVRAEYPLAVHRLTPRHRTGAGNRACWEITCWAAVSASISSWWRARARLCAAKRRR